MTSAQEEKANDLFEKAQKKMKSFVFYSSEIKFDEAQTMFIKAANLYKILNNWEKAGESFLMASECQKQMKDEYLVASHLLDAAKCFRKTNIDKSIELIEKAITIYLQIGKLNLVGKYSQDLAEFYEKKKDFKKAIEYYRKAADFYDTENNKGDAQHCLAKLAPIYADLEEYSQATQIYENLAMEYLDNPSLKYSVQEMFFMACLCRFCEGDLEVAQSAYERYLEQDVIFASHKKAKLIEGLIKVFEEGDLEAFSTLIFNYDQEAKLTLLQTTLLLRIKKLITTNQTKQLL
ncbi:alpha-soluble nsf attachment protein [Anaeramoeba ignava]|uniref:Alpha-soluble nsf attachment protein n=1 Tax=Anaeramoeba ignava TaxID=1746090 RepID=A0A9Q0LCM7_ANAIG|nr:alpha-soluble nsf attachment protein [Anaeramoeba ignava]